jgi:hypothetical protein
MKNEGLISILNSDNYEDIKLGIGILQTLKDSEYNVILDRLRFGENNAWILGLGCYLVRIIPRNLNAPNIMLRYK